MLYAQAAGADAQNSSQNGSQNGSERFYNKNMVVCFANDVGFDSLTEALNKEGYGKDVVGYQKIDFN